ncbi:hypothetical protein [Paenibacillus sp. FJAT-26967]|uniref:hypothetical protein n=1 Tax=Paenibacillus sp. FJAT-26967 TaxID=1729690 RepID=UPI000838381C|nr:hypothetical protein [Paenibacillus sp. FJAT-26967]
MSAESMLRLSKVPGSLLQERLVVVQDLIQNELEMYNLSKDRETGEHYVHYAYAHKQIAGSGDEEHFHQLLPVESDDVLGIMFSDQPYEYPHAWNRTFLRNGPDGFYVWFDPGYTENLDEDAKFAQEIQQRLTKLKQSGSVNEEAVQRLLEELDGMK